MCVFVERFVVHSWSSFTKGVSLCANEVYPALRLMTRVSFVWLYFALY